MAVATQPTAIMSLNDLNNAFLFDAVIDRTEQMQANVTQYAVEDGTTITDGAILSLPRMTVSGIISATPLTWKGYHAQGYTGATNEVEKLKNLWKKRKRVSVITRNRVYDDMLISGLTISESEDIKQGYEISVELTKAETAKQAVKSTQKAQIEITDENDIVFPPIKRIYASKNKFIENDKIDGDITKYNIGNLNFEMFEVYDSSRYKQIEDEEEDAGNASSSGTSAKGIQDTINKKIGKLEVKE